MLKTISLNNNKSLLLKRILKKEKMEKLEKAYEEYIYEGIEEAENKIKKGAKSYTEEEFAQEMRQHYGIII